MFNFQQLIFYCILICLYYDDADDDAADDSDDRILCYLRCEGGKLAGGVFCNIPPKTYITCLYKWDRF